MIRSYFTNIINEHKTQGEWKIKLTMAISFFFFSKDSEDTRTMNTRSDNIEMMMGNET